METNTKKMKILYILVVIGKNTGKITVFIYLFHFFLLLAIIPELLELHKEKKRLLFRGSKNRKGRGSNMTKKGKIYLYLPPVKISLLIFIMVSPPGWLESQQTPSFH